MLKTNCVLIHCRKNHDALLNRCSPRRGSDSFVSHVSTAHLVLPAPERSPWPGRGRSAPLGLSQNFPAADLDIYCRILYDEVITYREEGIIMGNRSDVYIVSESTKITCIGNHVYLHWGGVEALNVALDGLRCVVVGADRVGSGVVTSSVLDILFATQDEVVVTPFAAADIDEYVEQTRNGEHPVLVIDAVRGTVTVRGGSSSHSVGFDELSWSDPDLRGALAEEL